MPGSLPIPAFKHLTLDEPLPIASGGTGVDTLPELAAQLVQPGNAVGEALALKLAKSGNLSDLPDVSAARASLGLGNINNTSDATKAATGNPVGDAIVEKSKSAVELSRRVTSAQRGLRVNDLTLAAAAYNDALIADQMGNLAARGGGSLLLTSYADQVAVSAPIDNKFSRVMVEGPGWHRTHDAGPTPQGTTIVPLKDCTNAQGRGAVLRHRTPYGSESGISLGAINVGGGFRGLRVVGNLVAQRLLEVDSVTFGTHDLCLENAEGFETALYRCGVTGTDLGEACDVQQSSIRLNIRCLDTVNSKNAHGVIFSGSTNANFSLNRSVTINVQHYNGIALILQNADNNDIILNGYRPGGGTGLLAAGAAATDNPTASQYCRANRLRMGGNAPSFFEGMEKSGALLPSSMEEILIDSDNSTPLPTLGQGVICPVRTTAGYLYGYSNRKLVVGDSEAAINRARASQLASNDSLRVGNGSSNHIVLEDGTSRWGVAIDGATGDLRFLRLDGAGYVNLGNGVPVKLPNLINVANDTAAANAGVPVGGLYRNGPNVVVRIT